MTEHQHRVTHFSQPTPNACWWACTAMLMRFCGHAFHQSPSAFDGIFREPPEYRVGLRRASALRSPEDWYNDRRHAVSSDRRTADLARLRGTYANGFLHPSHWMRTGAPNDRAHLRLWVRLTPLRTSYLRYGARSGISAAGMPDDLEELCQQWYEAIAQRPLIVTAVSSAAGTGANRHAMIAPGVRRERDAPASSCQVLLQDPMLSRYRPTIRTILTVVATTDVVLACRAG